MISRKLLVVGGTGFIGSHIVDEAIKRGWLVTATCYLNNHPLKAIDSRYRLIQLNLNDTETLKKLNCTKFDYVINASGYIDHKKFNNGGSPTINTHFLGLMNLLGNLRYDSLKRFIHIGSSDEYGAAPSPQNEMMRELPISPYSLAKTAATHFFQMLYRTEQFPAVILRPFLVYGPGQGISRFLPFAIKNCLENRKFPMTEGIQIRDYCYVKDIVDAIFLMLETNGIEGEIFNVGSGSPISIKETVEMVKSIIGTGEPQYGELSYREGENFELYPDISKIRNLTGWNPHVNLYDGLIKTIDWYRSR